MLNRLTVTTLLTSLVGIMASCVVAIVAVDGWDSLARLQRANRISVIAEASGNAFKAMSNLRTDRSNTGRSLNADLPITESDLAYLNRFREASMPALRAVAAILPS